LCAPLSAAPPSAPRSATSTRSGNDAKLASPSRDVKTAPPMSAAPESAVRIVPENHCTDTRRRSTNALEPPSTDSGGSLPSSMASACLDRIAPRDRVWSKLAVPCASDRRRPYRNKTLPQLLSPGRVNRWPARCRLVHEPSMTASEPDLLTWLTVAEGPRCDSVPRKDPKDDAGIWPQYGAIWIKALFIHWAGIFLAADSSVSLRPIKTGLIGWQFSRAKHIYTDRRAVRLRRDCAPLKLLTGTVKRHPIVLGCTGFAGSPAYRRVGSAMVPGLFEKWIGRKRNVDGGVLAGRLLAGSNSLRMAALEETSAVHV